MWILKATILLTLLRCSCQHNRATDLLNLSLCVLDNGVEGICVKQSKCNNKPTPFVTTTEATIFEPSYDFESASRAHSLRQCHVAWETYGHVKIIVRACRKFEVCCNIQNIKKTAQKDTKPARGCGYSNSGGYALRQMSDGPKSTNASYSEFPWMVALMIKSDIPLETFADAYLGGGSIIHPSVIITTAHKVDGVEPNMIKCRAGEWNWLNDDELYKYQERDVRRIIIHNDYNEENLYYNVALLHLTSPYKLGTPNIEIACLQPTMPRPGTKCYSMGWGKDFTNGVSNVNTLKKVTLPLVDRVVCQEALRRKRLGPDYVLHKTLTCAGGEAGVDTCDGDGGSSLVCPIYGSIHKRYSVVGMVTYGIKCGLEQTPGVYVHVPEIIKWVDQQMTDLGLKIVYKYKK